MTSGCFQNAKVFGVGLDASDDPWTLQLKLAAIDAREKGMDGLCSDPYDAVLPELKKGRIPVESVGKLPLPSWLTPRPQTTDRHLVTKENMEAYVSAGGMLEVSGQIKRFVKEKVFPGQPIMLGVDHSATGGVVSALSEEIGAENLNVLVLDQHFDGLPLALRLEPRLVEQLNYDPSVLEDDAYCCGNFWGHLINNGVVLPENLLFVGVADYPGEKVSPEWERFRKSYHELEARGCHFFPLQSFKGTYVENLKRFIEDNISSTKLYVSLDLDVGAYRAVHAARYMDRTGMDRETLMEVVHIIAGLCRAGRLELAGMDLMEFNMHFLGIEIEPGKKDDTLGVAVEIVKALIF
jgi:arginase family enzyme